MPDGIRFSANFTKFVDDGMPGVAAALISDDNIVLLRQQVDHTAFTLVSPVYTDNCTI